MGVPKCCSMFNMKTGNIILGCLNACISLMFMVVMISSVCTTVYISSKTSMEVPTDEKDLNPGKSFIGPLPTFIILAVIFFAKFCVDIFFIYGIVSERRGILRAYLIVWLLFFCMAMFVLYLYTPKFSAVNICLELFYFTLNLYFVIISCFIAK